MQFRIKCDQSPYPVHAKAAVSIVKSEVLKRRQWKVYAQCVVEEEHSLDRLTTSALVSATWQMWASIFESDTRHDAIGIAADPLFANILTCVQLISMTRIQYQLLAVRSLAIASQPRQS